MSEDPHNDLATPERSGATVLTDRVASTALTDRADATRLARPTDELETAMRSMTRISADLLRSHGALAERAQRMERELCRANAELSERLGELDAVKCHLEAILQALPTGVVVRDGTGRIVRANRAALSILGVEESELVGATGHPGLRGALANGEPMEFARQDGRRLVLSCRTSAIDGADHAGEPGAGAVEILDDRTEVTRLTERVHRLDKLAALGNVAAGIAHEVRNPLNAVSGFAALLQRGLPEESRERRWADCIVEGACEANAILTSMLALAVPEALRLESVDAQELVTSAIQSALAPGDGAERWSIAHECSGETFAGDRIQLRQAIRNLVANAVQAQPSGGEVRVSLRSTGERITITVDDAGPGIPCELRQRVLEPFFTTRPQGTGLGLALAHKIAELHGGSLEISTDPSPLGGARISLSFPSAPRARCAAACAP